MEEQNEISLKFSESPLCPLAADVISDGESIYFYMYDLDFENERLIARSACWVKNLVPALKAFQKEKIEQDHQPILPSMFVDEAMDTKPWKEKDLEIVWSKEGHIAGLYHQGKVVCVIPSWADGHNVPGYALYAKENNMVAWKLADASVLISRIEEGKHFWTQEFNLTWKQYNTPYFSQLTELFGPAVNCYDLHKDVFPSRLLVTFIKDNEKYAFTIGVGMFSMPNADRYYPDYEDHARCEFAIHYPLDTLSEEEEMDLYASLAGLCGLPWHDMDCVGHGHTLDIAVKGRKHCILLDDDACTHPLSLSIKEDKVHLYWLKTITVEDLRLTKEEEAKEALFTSLCQDSSL